MTETNGIPIERCPQCGEIGTYCAAIDGVFKTIACRCGYNAPGMAVAGTAQEHPVDPEGDAAYWRARAERAETTCLQLRTELRGVERMWKQTIDARKLDYAIAQDLADALKEWSAWTHITPIDRYPENARRATDRALVQYYRFVESEE